MPELPEVETVVKGLRENVVGREFTNAIVHWPRELNTLSPDDFVDRLVGQRIEVLRRRGKYIVFELTHDVMLVHLKMSGRLYVAKTGTAQKDDRWVRITFSLDNDHELLCEVAQSLPLRAYPIYVSDQFPPATVLHPRICCQPRR